jgi:glucan phosphoethanolaminetransferase (alkaline phosphatase superfamily)
MKKELKEKLINFGLKILSVTIATVCAIKLIKENKVLIKENSNLKGQIDNQNYVIAGQRRIIERTSFINGKLAQKNTKQK